MATLKRIGPGSAFKVGLVTYAFVGLVVGACFALFSIGAAIGAFIYNLAAGWIGGLEVDIS